MVITKDVNLPEVACLNTTEVDLSMSTLMSAAPYVGKSCEGINNEFMLCRQETNDPRACIDLGKRVTACALQVFQRIKKNCLEEFKQYSNCIDKSSGDFSFSQCRNTQQVFDDCMLTKLCMERPHFGYFCRARVHTSSRPAPPPPSCPCHSFDAPDLTPSLPDCKERPRARFSSRLFWITE